MNIGRVTLDHLNNNQSLGGYKNIYFVPAGAFQHTSFNSSYGKPLVAARDSKCSAKDAEAGVLAMEALHKQVMPFLLRRTKDEVLTDLPEKIIQDRYCDLSPVQLKLYEQFWGSHVKDEISGMVQSNETESGEGEGKVTSKTSSHVFQALQFLLKLCSHPLLVLGGKIRDSLPAQQAQTLVQNSISCTTLPTYHPLLVLGGKIRDSLPALLPDLFAASSDISSELHKLHHSPNLVALQEILEECGIGVDASTSEGPAGHYRERLVSCLYEKGSPDGKWLSPCVHYTREVLSSSQAMPSYATHPIATSADDVACGSQFCLLEAVVQSQPATWQLLTSDFAGTRIRCQYKVRGSDVSTRSEVAARWQVYEVAGKSGVPRGQNDAAGSYQRRGIRCFRWLRWLSWHNDWLIMILEC
nr:TATA-binding protein-associated factor BTAF1 [Tanacetum cinerariifolium]